MTTSSDSSVTRCETSAAPQRLCGQCMAPEHGSAACGNVPVPAPSSDPGDRGLWASQLIAETIEVHSRTHDGLMDECVWQTCREAVLLAERLNAAAPAPSSDPVSLGCQDAGHQRLLDAARGMGVERDAFERGRHEGYHAGIAEQLASPVLSPTEAGELSDLEEAALMLYHADIEAQSVSTVQSIKEQQVVYDEAIRHLFEVAREFEEARRGR